MKREVALKTLPVLGMALGLMLGGCRGTAPKTAGHANVEGSRIVKSIYDFVVKGIDGKDVALADYKGKVLLIVNVASKCGFTGQYKGLQALYETHKDKGLLVLGFPSNDFMGQEPGTNDEIQQFCTLTYGVTFPMFAKLTVKGEDMHPLYEYLTSKETNPATGGAISWNFNKFLIARDGSVAGRFGSRTKPDDKELVEAIAKALQD